MPHIAEYVEADTFVGVGMVLQNVWFGIQWSKQLKLLGQ